MNVASRTRLWPAVWLLLSLPALGQLGLLFYTVWVRFCYPYDLEWMEGGLLIHAERLATGQAIYVEPSVEFIPYPYTPLYPALLALLGWINGISYQAGRAISILAMVAILGFAIAAIVRDTHRQDRRAGWAGAAIAGGFFAATYPWLEGWYDIVRADTLLCALVLGGLFAVRHWAGTGAGFTGQLRIGVAAAVLALAFLAKQTGFLFVATGGLVLLWLNWRRIAVYIAVAGTIGLGSTWLLNALSDGWYWTHVYQVHQSLDFNMDRFYRSFGYMLGRFPAMTGIIAVALAAVAATGLARRRLPRSCRGFLLWTLIFAISCVIGAMGWAVQWAHFNAYMPAMMMGCVACGSALPALAGCASEYSDPKRYSRRSLSGLAGAMAALVCALQLVAAWWQPAQFIPTHRDRSAGTELIRKLASIEGEIFVPYHPWYGHLAGKKTYLHRLALMTLNASRRGRVADLARSLHEYRFAAIVLNREPGAELSQVRFHYRRASLLPPTMRPRTYTGAKTFPSQIWLPAGDKPPP